MIQTQTHTHHKATCRTLTPPNSFQTVPHAAHTMRHRFKIVGVTSIELKWEECLKRNLQGNITCD